MSRILSLAVVLCMLLAPACSKAKRYPLKGQVLAVNTERQELTVKHEDIRGFMPGMTMPFKVRKGSDLEGRKPGDLITATLAVEETTGYLEDVVKTGEAPLPPGTSESPLLRMIEPGAAVPDAEFTDSTGRTRRMSEWRGQTVAVTFVYTRCPLPDFCPLMDRHFAAAQQAIRADPRLKESARLLSVSFDPDYDTPEVLRAHAARVGADPAIWTYATGTREAVDPFGAAFGVSIIREDKPLQEIVHNLRTAVITRDGRLFKVLNGNDWTPEQLLEAMREADAGR